MICPNCKTAQRGAPKIREQTGTDLEMQQQRRSRSCRWCGHRFETIEVLESEILRLRRLAYAQVMVQARTAA